MWIWFSALTQREASIYRIPLQSPAVTVKGLKAVAISLPEQLKDVIIKHPLVCVTSLLFFPKLTVYLSDTNAGKLGEGDYTSVFFACKFRGRAAT